MTKSARVLTTLELGLLIVIGGVAIVLWLGTAFSAPGRGGWQNDLQAAGDAVAAIAVLLSGAATVMALVTLRLQRDAADEQRAGVDAQLATMTEQLELQREAVKAQSEAHAAQLSAIREDQQLQRDALAIQREALKEQQRAIAEDHRLQHVAVLREKYGQYFTLAGEGLKTLIELWAILTTTPRAPDYGRVLGEWTNAITSLQMSQLVLSFLDGADERHKALLPVYEQLVESYKQLAADKKQVDQNAIAEAIHTARRTIRESLLKNVDA